MAETIANAYVAYLRLVERGKADQAYPSPLVSSQSAKFALADGSAIGSRRRTSCHPPIVM